MKNIYSSTLDLFTKATFENDNRGLGFDKPEPEKGTYLWGSLSSFGHTGFTGTIVGGS